MVIEQTFNIGQYVVRRTDPDGLRGIVTGITVRAGGSITYGVSNTGIEMWFFDFELEALAVGVEDGN
jgi:hypothetical protein